MKKLFSSVSVAMILMVAGVVAVPAATFAQTTTVSAAVQAQLDLIASLTKQIQALQQQMLGLQQQQTTATASLVSSLSLGSQGDQVKILQALLAADPNIYPEGLITGFFGHATERAVKRFQQANGISQIGIVGPKTLAKLNQDLDENPISFESTSTATSTNGNDNGQGNEGKGHGRPCAIVPPGHLIAPGWLRKNDGVAPIVPPCQTLPPGIEDHFSTSTPTSTPPVILAISGVGSTVATSSATVTWSTNLTANSQIMYGLTSGYGSSTALDSSLVTSHSEILTGLTPNTVYHFQVVSANASGTVTSSDMTFATNALDVTPPVISGITFSVASTTASVSWNTNEAATSLVYYGTVNPLDITSTSTQTASNVTLVTGHGLTLSGLTASTTYFFVVQSADASANTATSSQMSFTTTN